MIEHGAHYVSFGNIRSTWKYLSTGDEFNYSSYVWVGRSWFENIVPGERCHFQASLGYCGGWSDSFSLYGSEGFGSLEE